MLADGSMPRLPVSMEASSERMSPKRLPVTMVSNSLGFRSSDMAQLSTYLHYITCQNGQLACRTVKPGELLCMMMIVLRTEHNETSVHYQAGKMQYARPHIH